MKKSRLLINLKLCFLEIFANRTRFSISTIGLFIGVSSLLYNLAFIRGMEKDTVDRMQSIGGLNIINIEYNEPESPEEKLAARRSQGLTLLEVKEICSQLSYVKAVLPQEDMHWGPLKSEGQQTYGRIRAVSDGFWETYNYQLAKGRRLLSEDYSRMNAVCLIGGRVATELFGTESPLGKTLTVKGLPMEIVGVTVGESRQDRRSMECLFPYSLYWQRMGGFAKPLDELDVVLTDAKYAQQATEELTHALKQSHRGVVDFEVTRNEERLEEMKNASLGIRMVLWCVAAISLIVSGISIMNIMFASLAERIREIGVRKALGAAKRDILIQFNLEAILVCLLGGLPGLLAGASITLFPNGMFPFQPMLRPEDYFLAVGFTLITGFLAGLFPAMRASRLNPVEALRF